MSDLIALVPAALPILALLALFAMTVRAGTSARRDPGAEFTYRAYGA